MTRTTNNHNFKKGENENQEREGNVGVQREKKPTEKRKKLGGGGKKDSQRLKNAAKKK